MVAIERLSCAVPRELKRRTASILASVIDSLRNTHPSNTARGGLVDTDALVDAVSSGRIAGAALDVFEEEPIPERHPLFDLDGVILTPHVAGSTRDAVLGGPRIIASQLEDYFDDETLPHVVVRRINHRLALESVSQVGCDVGDDASGKREDDESPCSAAARCVVTSGSAPSTVSESRDPRTTAWLAAVNPDASALPTFPVPTMPIFILRSPFRGPPISMLGLTVGRRSNPDRTRSPVLSDSDVPISHCYSSCLPNIHHFRRFLIQSVGN